MFSYTENSISKNNSKIISLNCYVNNPLNPATRFHNLLCHLIPVIFPFKH